MTANDNDLPDLSAFDRARIDTTGLAPAGYFVDVGFTDTDGQEYVAGWVDADQLWADAQRLADEVDRRATARRIADRQTQLLRATAQRHVDARARASMARARETAAGTDDVLGRLDAAAEGLCACGCSSPITSSSPSAYYASPECQQAWMARHVDNPQEVYQRRDAADYPRRDDGVQTLNEPARRRPGRDVRAAMDAFRSNLNDLCTAVMAEQVVVYRPGAFPDPLQYRRTCPACDTFMAPLIYDEQRTGAQAFDPDYRTYVTGPVWTQECSTCHTAIVGTVHMPTLTRSVDPACWVLELHTTYGRVRSNISDLALDRLEPAAREEFVARTWGDMERDLSRFEREWRGRLNRAEERLRELARTVPINVPPHLITDPL